MYDDFGGNYEGGFDKEQRPSRSSGKKDVKNMERRVDSYSVDVCKSGYCVRWESRTGNILFCDREKMWLRSKKPLEAMTETKCKAYIAEFQAQDHDQKFVKF